MSRDLQTASIPAASSRGETVFRMVMLGAVYAGAVLIAVAFSPAAGFMEREDVSLSLLNVPIGSFR